MIFKCSKQSSAILFFLLSTQISPTFLFVYDVFSLSADSKSQFSSKF